MSHNYPSRNVNSGGGNAAVSSTRLAGSHDAQNPHGTPTQNGSSKFYQNATGAGHSKPAGAIAAAAAVGGGGSGGGGGGVNNIPTISRQQDNWIKARQIHQQQLLTEHFGFSPLSFVDDVINSVNNMIYQASMALQEYVEMQMDEMSARNALPDNTDVKVECGKSMHKFETLLESSVDKNFDRFELYALKNLFGVPEDVDIVLPHYEALDFNIGVEREQQLDEQLEILRRKVIATKALNYRLRKELEIEENRRRQLQKCQEQIQFLKDSVKEYADGKIKLILGDIEPNFYSPRLPQHTNVLPSVYSKIKLQQNANRVATNTSGSSGFHSTSAQGLTASNSAASPNHQPADSVTLALHESLLNMEPDQRSVYIRSVVRRQIDEQLMLDSSFVANGGHIQAPPTP
ncbi:hypothetical protein BGX27_003727 [Mortierella sp. AM989]|nr:hypothetical protein BGX27_003727 [Mortierella sp. AM989]